jgi:hypothetical protein
VWLYPVPIGIGPGRGGGACNRELPRISILGTSVNKVGHKAHEFIAASSRLLHWERRSFREGLGNQHA